MHPEHNVERRQARAKALHKRFEHMEHVVCVDAAEYPDRAAMAVAIVDGQGYSVTCGSVRTAHPEVGQEVAIALAISFTPAKFIVSDSKSAIRNFAKAWVSPEAQPLVRGIQLVWAPARSDLSGNEKARGLSLRDCPYISEPSLRAGGRDRLVTDRYITAIHNMPPGLKGSWLPYKREGLTKTPLPLLATPFWAK